MLAKHSAMPQVVHAQLNCCIVAICVDRHGWKLGELVLKQQLHVMFRLLLGCSVASNALCALIQRKQICI